MMEREKEMLTRPVSPLRGQVDMLAGDFTPVIRQLSGNCRVHCVLEPCFSPLWECVLRKAYMIPSECPP